MPNYDNQAGKHWLTRGLGWFALGLGAAELVAPKRVARWLGLRPSTGASGMIRACGMREALTGVGILSSRAHARGWLGTRVVGDAIDAGLLWRALNKQGKSGLYRWLKGTPRARLKEAMVAVGAVSVLDVAAAMLARQASRRSRASGASTLATASVTIDKTPAEVYAFWRDVENLPRFITGLESVTTTDRIRSHWRAKLPHGPALEWDAVITEDTPDQRIAWQVESTSPVMLVEAGEVRFEPAPAGTGTEVYLVLRGGLNLGPKSIARWLRKLPERFWSAQLHRLKQLLELGEVTVSDASAFMTPHPAQPAKEELTSAPLGSSGAPIPGPGVGQGQEPKQEGRPS